MDTLYSTEPHYVRCIKANSQKAPDSFQSGLILEQLRYSGIFEAVAIRKQGYPFRHKHQQFRERYAMLVPRASPERAMIHKNKSMDAKAQCKAMLAAMSKGNDLFKDCQIGKTMVLYRAPQQRALERQRAAVIEACTRTLERFVRGHQGRKRVNEIKYCEAEIAEAIVLRDLERLDLIVAKSRAVATKLEQMEIYRTFSSLSEASVLREMLIEERDMCTEIEKIIDQPAFEIYEVLNNYLKRAEELGTLLENYPILLRAAEKKAAADEVMSTKSRLIEGARTFVGILSFECRVRSTAGN